MKGVVCRIFTEWYFYLLRQELHIHHAMQEEKKWELCTALFLTCLPSTVEHEFPLSLCASWNVKKILKNEQRNRDAAAKTELIQVE